MAKRLQRLFERPQVKVWLELHQPRRGRARFFGPIKRGQSRYEITQICCVQRVLARRQLSPPHGLFVVTMRIVSEIERAVIREKAAVQGGQAQCMLRVLDRLLAPADVTQGRARQEPAE